MHRYRRSAGTALVFLLLSAAAGVAQSQQNNAANQPTSVPTTGSTGKDAVVPEMPSGAAVPNGLPDSPGAVRFQIVAANEQGTADVAQQAPPAKPSAEQQPVGTAAAESIQTSGVAASAPAGTAIAPAKQRQVRSLLIRMGAVLGAGAAVGTAVALSEATPSKPPGAH
jgi:hypothetical protein